MSPIAKEVLAAAAEVTDPYWTVAIAAWALLTLVERGCKAACSASTPSVLECTRRMDVLELLIHAVFDVDSTSRLMLVELLVACRCVSNWKAPRCLA